MWKFDASLGENRVTALLTPPTFDSLIAQIEKEMRILCCHPQDSTDKRGFRRSVYCVYVGEPLFDWFFNSQNGYRAAYFHSLDRGLEANAQFIQSMMPRLLKWGDGNSHGFDRGFACESLTRPSAKVWLAESGPHIDNCEGCTGEWRPPNDDKAEILNGRWEDPKLEDAKCPYAKYGRKAPYLTKLRIFGAFLDGDLEEWTPPRKLCRAQEIHDWGWS